jgi:hypothetical protein
MHLSSRSASHSRSHSPALAPSAFPSNNPVPSFSRSTSQSFPASQSQDLLSPPLTPPVSYQHAAGGPGGPGGGSLLSKDDLMSWAGGSGLSVTNKQTGVQSTQSLSTQPQQSQLSPPSSSTSASANAVDAAIARQLSTSPSTRSRHSLPPTSAASGVANRSGMSNSHSFSLAPTIPPSASSASTPNSTFPSSTAGGSKNIPDFLKEQAAWMAGTAGK